MLSGITTPPCNPLPPFGVCIYHRVSMTCAMILLCPSGTSRRREAPTTVAFICTAWICFRNVFFWNWLPPTLKYILYIQPGNIFSIFYSPTIPTRVVETLSLKTLGRKGAPTPTSLNDGLSFSNSNSIVYE